MLSVRGLAKSFRGRSGGTIAAVRDVSLAVGGGEFFTLLGPSGCGKSTALRCIAGLETADAGEVELRGRLLSSPHAGVHVQPNERGIGMVFQSYAIWPHMTVFENAAFPLRVRPRRERPSRAALRARVERALETVRLAELSSRPATDLSGGQQQRLALARALVSEPPLLLLDEPLSNLDARLRDEMRFELKRIQAELGVATLYVTHDQEEALALSDVVAVMRDGALEQVGTPADVYERPASPFVADFIGRSNLIAARVAREGGGAYELEAGGCAIRAASAERFERGAEVMLAIRAERISISPPRSQLDGENCLEGIVRARAFLGGAVEHLVGIGDLTLHVRGLPSESFAPGTPVAVTFPPDSASLMQA